MNFIINSFVVFLLHCGITLSAPPVVEDSWKWLSDTERTLWQYCQYHDQLINKPDPKFCSNFVCWESQLTDSTRYLLTLYYNAFRIKVALKLCNRCTTEYENINYMEYHWYLEFVAQNILKTKCELSVPTTSIKLEVEYLKDAAQLLPRAKFFEYAGTSMPFAKYTTQKDWIDDFLGFLDPATDTGPNNILGDFNREHFRRGTAFFFGCAIVVRDGVSGTTGVGISVNGERVAHLLCVYAAWLPFSSQRGMATEETCKTPPVGRVGLADTVFLKAGVIGSGVVCRRQTHIHYDENLLFGSSAEKLVLPVEDIPCQVYLPDYANSPIYQSPCPGGNTETWRTPSVLFPNYTVSFAYTNKTAIPKTGQLALAVFNAPNRAKVVNLSTVISTRHPYEQKFCFILILLYFLVLACFFLALALIFKYRVEQNSFENDFGID